MNRRVFRDYPPLLTIPWLNPGGPVRKLLWNVRVRVSAIQDRVRDFSSEAPCEASHG